MRPKPNKRNRGQKKYVWPAFFLVGHLRPLSSRRQAMAWAHRNDPRVITQEGEDLFLRGMGRWRFPKPER